MPKELDFENLQLCLDNYQADSIFIRLVGSSGGTIKVNESLENRKLDFRKNKSGLYISIDSDEVFHFPLKDSAYHKGFSLAYERIKKVDKYTQMIMLGTGVDPYDPTLPEPKRSFLRNVFDYHLIEIFFKGRVDIEFHSWWKEPDWKYWTVKK